MATVRELLDRKGSDLLMVDPDTTVLEASRLMNDRGVGSVLVMTDGALTGIFTERDLMRRVVAVERLPGATKVAEVMTSSLVTCTPDATMQDCGTVMSERRIRHLPVVDEGGVVGLVTTGDLLAHEL
ncbi:MAG: CBS domain-containing protein, partial [Gemmatimonadales bacterium]